MWSNISSLCKTIPAVCFKLKVLTIQFRSLIFPTLYIFIVLLPAVRGLRPYDSSTGPCALLFACALPLPGALPGAWDTSESPSLSPRLSPLGPLRLSFPALRALPLSAGFRPVLASLFEDVSSSICFPRPSPHLALTPRGSAAPLCIYSGLASGSIVPALLAALLPVPYAPPRPPPPRLLLTSSAIDVHQAALVVSLPSAPRSLVVLGHISFCTGPVSCVHSAVPVACAHLWVIVLPAHYGGACLSPPGLDCIRSLLLVWLHLLTCLSFSLLTCTRGPCQGLAPLLILCRQWSASHSYDPVGVL